jgi:hypothetical protein
MDIIAVTNQFSSGTTYTSSSPNKAANQAAQAKASSTGKSQSDSSGIIQGVNYIKEQLKDYMDSFPPWFPVGHSSRPDMIKQIRSITSTVKSSAIDLSLKKKVSGKTLTDNANDNEIGDALGKLYSLRDALTQTTESNNSSVAGNLLNIKA